MNRFLTLILSISTLGTLALTPTAHAYLTVAQPAVKAQPPSPLAQDEIYTCKAADVKAKYAMDEVTVRKSGATGKLLSEVSFKTDLGKVTYGAEMKYTDNPKFAFPSWDGEGMSIITERKAKDFKATSFSGCINGHTDEFDFSANLACTKVGAPNEVMASKH